MHAARADVFYNFAYTLSDNVNNGSDYSGTFDVSGGTIVGITGTSSEYGTITELLAPGSYPLLAGAPNDNLFSPTAPYVDAAGVSFAMGSTDANIYLFTGSDYGEVADSNQTNGSFGTLTVSLFNNSVPEPASATLFGLGTLALATLRRRRNVG
jgi:hypothetical protein